MCVAICGGNFLGSEFVLTRSLGKANKKASVTMPKKKYGGRLRFKECIINQFYEVEAESKNEARDILENGDGNFIHEEVHEYGVLDGEIEVEEI